MDVSRPYKRILLKLSGEALLGDTEYGVDPSTIDRIAEEIFAVQKQGIEICVVIGGGNIFRGVSGASQGMDRATADYMGMLATVMNALALQNALEKHGAAVRVQSAISMDAIAEPYIRAQAMNHMRKKRIVIFAAGSGNPFFTTDTAAALRASEMGCDVILKGTKVDGVYDKDPSVDSSAVKYNELRYADVLSKDLKVMDAAAISLARDNHIPIVVFSIQEKHNLANIVKGDGNYTIIH